MNGGEPIFIDNNSKTGVLLLHGFSSVPRQFKELSEFISEKGFNIYAPLIAGHGTSYKDLMATGPKDWERSAMDAYLELKKISEKVFIIGNSFGSNLGLWIAKETNNEPAGIITLGAPIFFRFHKFSKIRLATYGRFWKFYKKPSRVYKADYTDMVDEVSYPILPVKSLKEVFSFLEEETIPSLKKVKIPILIASPDVDLVVHPKSGKYIFENIGSSIKEFFCYKSPEHGEVGRSCEGLFEKIYDFLSSIK